MPTLIMRRKRLYRLQPLSVSFFQGSWRGLNGNQLFWGVPLILTQRHLVLPHCLTPVTTPAPFLCHSKIHPFEEAGLSPLTDLACGAHARFSHGFYHFQRSNSECNIRMGRRVDGCNLTTSGGVASHAKALKNPVSCYARRVTRSSVERLA